MRQNEYDNIAALNVETSAFFLLYDMAIRRFVSQKCCRVAFNFLIAETRTVWKWGLTSGYAADMLTILPGYYQQVAWNTQDSIELVQIDCDPISIDGQTD